MRSITYGSETVRFRGPQLWCTLSIRLSTNMAEFKAKIKVWKDDQSLEGYLAFMTCFLYYELCWHFLLNYIYTCTFYANFVNKVVIIIMIIIIMMMMMIMIIIIIIIIMMMMMMMIIIIIIIIILIMIIIIMMMMMMIIIIIIIIIIIMIIIIMIMIIIMMMIIMETL